MLSKQEYIDSVQQLTLEEARKKANCSDLESDIFGNPEEHGNIEKCILMAFDPKHGEAGFAVIWKEKETGDLVIEADFDNNCISVKPDKYSFENAVQTVFEGLYDKFYSTIYQKELSS